MVRPRKPKHTELYDKYPDFNRYEIAYIKIVTNPERKLEKTLSDADIAEMLGVTRRTVFNYWQKPEIRKAIVNETQMKSAAVRPNIIGIIEDMAQKLGDYKDINLREQQAALKLWKDINVSFFPNRKPHTVAKDSRETVSEVDKEFLALEREYEKDNAEVQE